jgi:hypothetical protein
MVPTYIIKGTIALVYILVIAALAEGCLLIARYLGARYVVSRWRRYLEVVTVIAIWNLLHFLYTLNSLQIHQSGTPGFALPYRYWYVLLRFFLRSRTFYFGPASRAVDVVLLWVLVVNVPLAIAFAARPALDTVGRVAKLRAEQRRTLDESTSAAR